MTTDDLTVLTKDEMARMSLGYCPDCGHCGFRLGPRGGAAMNISCGGCKQPFNVTNLSWDIVIGYRLPRPKELLIMTGISACERHLRNDLEHIELIVREELHRDPADGEPVAIPFGVLRGVLRDLEMWREIVENDPDKWSFGAVITLSKRLLDTVYPEKVFTGESKDSGPQLIAALRAVLAHVDP